MEIVREIRVTNKDIEVVRNLLDIYNADEDLNSMVSLEEFCEYIASEGVLQELESYKIIIKEEK